MKENTSKNMENNTSDIVTDSATVCSRSVFSPRELLINFLAGIAMGVAFIIPGFSGGSIAAILGVFEKLINAVTGIFTSFKRNVLILLPTALGMSVGAVTLLFPIKWGLENFPLPTICLFVGLTIGGMPSLTDKVKGKITVSNIAACLLPLGLAVSLCFLPVGTDVNLIGIGFFDYAILFVIGIIGSTAMVVPGISGSMLLLILGYYNPIVRLLTDNLLKGENVLSALLVLDTVALGIVSGFIGISFMMKFFFTKYPRGTYFAIIGFVVGSIPSVFVSTFKEAGITVNNLPGGFLHWFISALLLIFGAAMSLFLVYYAKKRAGAEKA